MENLPQIMQDLWPWVLWVGGLIAVFIGIATLIGMGYKSARSHKHHVDEPDDGQTNEES